MAAVSFQARLKQSLLTRGLVTWEAMEVRLIPEDIGACEVCARALSCQTCKHLNGRWILIPEASILLMASLDTTGCLEDGKWCRTNSSDVVRKNVVAFMITRSSDAFMFLGRPDRHEGLERRCLVHASILTAVRRQRRLEFARQYHNWTSIEWRQVVFSTESLFLLHRVEGRWRIRHETSENANFVWKCLWSLYPSGHGHELVVSVVFVECWFPAVGTVKSPSFLKADNKYYKAESISVGMWNRLSGSFIPPMGQ
ncbi:transposable element Tcb1 transposase [Trichonephila clavipes]|nr:transposable element Tcb1 transposase [Trichonephila clavipes]